jgi:N-acetyl-anhydromuramyl-L-alanine amidase AmpD
MQLELLDFTGRYVHQASFKNQIVMHHTVSGDNAQKVVDYWKKQPSLIGTSHLIDRQGKIYQVYDDSFWAGHVGDTTQDMAKFSLIPRNCSKSSLGVELLSMGGLKMYHSKLLDAYGYAFKGEVEQVSHRGYSYFEKYTTEQIQSLKELLLYWRDKYNIPLTMHGGVSSIFDLQKEALNGTPGLYTHCSFRHDKSDLYPSDELMAMLETLND